MPVAATSAGIETPVNMAVVGIPVPVSAATEMLQEAETLGQKGTEAARTLEQAEKASIMVH